MGRLSLLFPIILCLLFEFPSFSFSSPRSFSCLPNQSSALLQFKASFTLDTDKTATWENETDCCSWLGVTCNPISGHVIGLDLSCEGLQGKIHPNTTLFLLTQLQTLNLAFNYFSNSHLPSQFGSLVSLTHLNLSSSILEGEIPSQISHLSNLVSLDLSCNSFNGILKWKETAWRSLIKNATSLRELVLDYTDMSSIRLLNLSSSLVTLSLSATGLKGNLANDIFCLPNLQHLYLSSNPDLHGSIPLSFSNLSHLISLDLSSNNINGSIPSSLLTLPYLTSLDLSHNQLSGQISDVFPQSNRFQELHLSDNNIGGVLPSSLSNLHHLIHLELTSNKFSGQIPNVFGGLTKLKTLDIGNNTLEGQIPSSLFDLTQLSRLDCSHNKLEGLPKNITSFSNLTMLSLKDNLLNGTIPSWCLSLPSLENLDMSTNKFTGHIGAISSHSLEVLALYDNKLEGDIPESIFNLVYLTDLDLSSNNLSGHLRIQHFSKIQNLEFLHLSGNNQLSLTFKSDINYSFIYLEELGLASIMLTDLPNLSGYFPNLVTLDLSNNQISGRVPDNWLHEIGSITFLDLSHNLLTSSVGLLTVSSMLYYLDLSFNLLEGDLSLSINCNANLLQVLLLSHNKFTGTIPPYLGNLPSLSFLDLQMNKLHGTLPSNFSKKNELRALNFNGNRLEGPLPKSLSHCTKLEFLDLSNNQIEDTFPHWLQSLPYLRVLVLRGNKFYGPIASRKVRHPFTSLMIFDISCNNLSGPIPKAYIENFKAMKNVIRDEVDGSVKYMETAAIGRADHDVTVTVTIKDSLVMFSRIPTIFSHIDLSKNLFDGDIPDVIGELHRLKGLNLSHNRLTGPIPRSMGSLENLESLDLSANMLTGGIPTELTNLNYLEVLNLSYNHLVGEIPQGKQFNTFSNDSYEENWRLCGLPLSKKCHMNPEKHFPSSTILWKEEKFLFGWKPVAIGYGCGMIFGVGMGYYVFSIGKPQWLVRMFGGQLNKKLKKRTKKRTRRTINQLVHTV